MNGLLDITPPLFDYYDLFSGGGVAGCGIHQAGFRGRLSIDINTNALNCHRANHPDVPVLQRPIKYVTGEDIIKITGIPRGAIHHIHASAPCIFYSTSNTKAASKPPEDINENWYLFIDLIQKLQPMCWTGEGVEGMMVGEKIPYFNEIIRKLNRTLPNYDFRYKLMNCAYYGTPQDRMRVIFIGKRLDIAPGMPIQFPKPNIQGTKYLALKNVLPYIEKFDPKQFKPPKQKDNSHLFCTIPATDCIEVCVNGEWRKLTIPEIKVLMGVPREFILPDMNRISKVRILGNGVPPPIMRCVMLSVRQLLTAHFERKAAHKAKIQL
jgi:site-specific DNA-cytosine methylase